MFKSLFFTRPQRPARSNNRQFARQRGTSSNSSTSSSGLSSNSLSRRHRPDYSLLIIALLLSVIGLVVVYAISPGLAATKGVDNNYFVIKQLIAIGLGLAAFTLASFISIGMLQKARHVLLGLTAAGILIVMIAGEEINGATRWIQVGGFSFQIAEMIKLTLIVWLTMFLVERMRNGEINDSKKTLRPLLIVIGLIGVVVAGIQSDLGSTGVMIAIIGVLGYTAGLPLKKIGIIVTIIAVLATLAIASTPYRRDRVTTFLNPQSDCQATGYQACQALIAVGSGGMFGLGLGSGVQAYGYLPEAANDSIFAILAEKFGFMGVAAVLGLYLLLFSRFKRIIERTREPFARLFVVGVLAWISTQTIINVGAMIGLLPLKGITLPFISYGGTSILFIMAALGLVFQISRYTSFEPIRSSNKMKAKEPSYDHRPMRRRVGRPYYAASARRS
ncbi:MAG: FtsW/RodA/SpoVE family cell cycle protein [Candidatus Saccharimonadales bacterium]